MQKKRNPFIHWLIAVLTFGAYGLVWIYKMVADANAIAGEERIKIKKNVCITIALFATYLVLFSITMQKTLEGFDVAQAGGTPEGPGLVFFINWLVGLAWIIHLVSLVVRTANIARTKTEIPSSVVLGILTFVYFIALPILQGKLNKIEHNQPEVATP